MNGSVRQDSETASLPSLQRRPTGMYRSTQICARLGDLCAAHEVSEKPERYLRVPRVLASRSPATATN